MAILELAMQLQRSDKIFAELQFKSMNICSFSIKLPILVTISATVIEILK